MIQTYNVSLYCVCVSAMDALFRTMMKSAVNCVRHCDLQNFVNQEVVECGMRFGETP